LHGEAKPETLSEACAKREPFHAIEPYEIGYSCACKRWCPRTRQRLRTYQLPGFGVNPTHLGVSHHRLVRGQSVEDASSE
jgi:hypothetical protein